MDDYSYTIHEINKIFYKVEDFGTMTYIKGWALCLTGYIFEFCLPNPYDRVIKIKINKIIKALKKVEEFISEQNINLFHPKGLHLHSPMEKSLRLVELRF